MNNNNSGQISNLLGMIKRSGRLTTGYGAVVRMVSSSKGDAMVMMAYDLSAKTEKELRFALQNNVFKVVNLPLNKQQIGQALGLNKPVGVLGIDDTGFCGAVQALCRCNEGDS